MIEHFYEDVHGWFDFQNIYKAEVEKAKDGSWFVEVGAWLGRSTAFMAVEIANSAKKIKFDVVDTWRGNPDEMHHFNDVLSKCNGCAYGKFILNMKAGGVMKYINAIHAASLEAAEEYEDETLDFVFIDACHAYEYITSDINAWLPKVKYGGILAGHDYNRDSVKKAVHELLDDVSVNGTSWIYRKARFPKFLNLGEKERDLAISAIKSMPDNVKISDVIDELSLLKEVLK